MTSVEDYKALKVKVAQLEATMWRTKSKADTALFSTAFCQLGKMRRALEAQGIDITNRHALPDKHILNRDSAIERRQDGDA